MTRRKSIPPKKSKPSPTMDAIILALQSTPVPVSVPTLAIATNRARPIVYRAMKRLADSGRAVEFQVGENIRYGLPGCDAPGVAMLPMMPFVGGRGDIAACIGVRLTR